MPDLTIKSVPTSISRKTRNEAIAMLGFQPDQVRELILHKDTVYAEVLVQNEDGNGFADANKDAAVFQTYIAVQ
jgi:hypothetical protein